MKCALLSFSNSINRSMRFPRIHTSSRFKYLKIDVCHTGHIPMSMCYIASSLLAAPTTTPYTDSTAHKNISGFLYTCVLSSSKYHYTISPQLFPQAQWRFEKKKKLILKWIILSNFAAIFNHNGFFFVCLIFLFN